MKLVEGIVWKSERWYVEILLVTAVFATSIIFTVYSCDRYTDAMKKLNANLDYIESSTLDDAASNILSASSELDYSPERVWRTSHEVCTSRNDEGNCTSHSTYYTTHRTPEDCPDPLDARSRVQSAMNFLEKTGGGEQGINPENESTINKLKAISSSLPACNELCYYRDRHASESTFAGERHLLESVEGDVEAHSAIHYARVPSDLKSERNWSVFGIVISVLGVAASVVYAFWRITAFESPKPRYRGWC